MKTPIAISLVIVGGLLVVAPMVFDYFQRQQVVDAMAKPGVTSVSISPELTKYYRFGCWLTGTASIAAALYFSRRNGNRSASA